MSKFKTTQSYNSETFLEEIEVLVPKNEFDKYFENALSQVMKTASAPGFRKGNVPKNVVLANRYNQIADLSVQLVVNDAIKDMGEVSPKPLDLFQVKSINSASENADSDLKIVLTYLPMPEVKLPDYKTVKVTKPEPKKTTTEEVEQELKNIWFSYVQKYNPEAKKEDYSKEKFDAEFFEKSGIKAENSDLDSYEKLEKFVEDFINKTYEQSALVDWDNAIKEELIQKGEYQRIEGLVNREVEKRVENYLAKFKEIGMDPAEYLSKSNVNLDDLKKDWKEQSEKDVKFELILQEFGKQNNITPSDEELEAELSKLDPQTKKAYNYDEDRLKNLITYYYINNKAYLALFKEIRGEETN